jgi:hypothetical protein
MYELTKAKMISNRHLRQPAGSVVTVRRSRSFRHLVVLLLEDLRPTVKFLSFAAEDGSSPGLL